MAGLEHSPNLSFFDSVKETLHEFKEAFAAPVRGRTIFGCSILGMQLFSGIDGVLYYAPIMFRQAGLDSTQASFFASGVSALVMMIITIPATLMCDLWGRKTSSLVGGSLTSFFMLLISSLYAAGKVYADRGVAWWVVIVSVYLFACVFSATWALGLRMYLIESLPRKTRSSGASLAQASNWVRLSNALLDLHERERQTANGCQFANYIVALTTPVFLATSTFAAYYFFTFSTLFCTVMCAFCMIETKGHSLEFIEQKFSERQLNAEAVGKWWRLGGQSFGLRSA